MNISDVIRKLRDQYVFNEEALSYYEINNGLCFDLASDVVEIMDDESLEELVVENFKKGDDNDPSGDDVWDWDLLENNWNISPPEGMKKYDMDKICLGCHAWVFYDGYHYDAECPDGVENFFDLPIFKKIINSHSI